MRAKAFAIKKHKGQIYGENGDYFTEHIQVVVDTVKVHTDDILTIVGAFLHDTLEDTDTTYEELVNEFGKEVADLVLELTHEGTKKTGYYFPRLKSIRARRIKMADRLSNIFRLENWSKERVKAYLEKSVFWETKKKLIGKIYIFIELDPTNYYVIKAETVENATVIMKDYFKKLDIPTDSIDDWKVEEYNIPESEGLITVIDGGWK